MADGRQDDVVNGFQLAVRRRPFLGLLAGVPLGLAFGLDDADAKKKNRKKKLFCLNGKQVKAKHKKKKRRLRSQGATRGTCTAAACPAGQISVNGACTPCTVTCSGSATACGTALQTAILAGGTVIACPGEYQAGFGSTTNVVLYGAGNGTDAASNTILRGTGSAGVLKFASNTTVTLDSLYITGGTATALPYLAGGGILTAINSTLTVNNCVVTENGAQFGGGISASGALNVLNSQITNNTCIGNSAGCGLHLSEDVTTIKNSVVSGNTGPNDAEGGGLLAQLGAQVSIENSKITGNTSGNGSAVWVTSNTPATVVTIDAQSEITGNTATGTAPVYAVALNVTVGTATATVEPGANVSGNTPATQCGPGVTGC
ncbi:MAG: hypothetical protein QM692_14065 [Thermomicrobiales bacterium]